MNFLCKTNVERDRRLNFVIFAVWSSLIAGGWTVLVWSRKFYLGPPEKAYFVFLVLFKDGGPSWVQDSILQFLVSIKGMRSR